MANRLAGATSPYLLQHQHNPVDWHQWDPEALARARTEDRPILLSIGYAACHWCHVMERESFEDTGTAEVMNEHFVCIKVDREERPDLDAIYMEAVQAMTGQGGWPMTVFLTPDLRPFYAGTYFPPVDRHGLPGFRRLLLVLAAAWRERRGELVEQGRKVAEVIGGAGALAASPDPLTEHLLTGAVSALERAFDAEWGGFGEAPKFPQPMVLDFLLRAHARGIPNALSMATTTLEKMAAGGIFDQLGGGFHRYSTDRRWLVPHFEKMLYDNSQLAQVYLRAWQLTGRAELRTVATRTLDYMLRELRHPDGGFYSSQDADSEGEEGRFFVWSTGELRMRGVDGWFGATEQGNWEGTNVLWHPQGLARAEAERPPGAVLEAMFEDRSRRVHPATDDKVLAAWNALAISALAEAGRVLGEARYLDAAAAAATFVLEKMRPQGRLARSWRDGRTAGPGFLDDVAGMTGALLDLYETTGEGQWIDAARELARAVVERFGDPRGGFFQVAEDAASDLLTRPKDLFDNAVPAGSSQAAMALQRLGLLTGDPGLEAAGVSALRAVRPLLERAPTGFGTALSALDLYLGPSQELAVVGPPEARRPFLGVAWSAFRPRLVLAQGDGVTATVQLLEGRPAPTGEARAYLCRRFVCGLPAASPEELAAQFAV